MMRNMPVYLDTIIQRHCEKPQGQRCLVRWGRQQTPHQFMALGATHVCLLSRRASRWRCWLDVIQQNVVFTSGGTESNNLVLAQYDYVITSAIEHDSVRHAHDRCQMIAVDENGIIDLNQLAATLSMIDDTVKPDTIISVMAANNETGVLQPIEKIAEMACSSNLAFHSDMVQVFGKKHLDFTNSEISYASFSAHKIGGPTGVGALLVRPGCRLASLLRGGGQEQGRRSGTENLIGIAGFGAAAADALGDIGHYNKMAEWRDEL